MSPTENGFVFCDGTEALDNVFEKMVTRPGILAESRRVRRALSAPFKGRPEMEYSLCKIAAIFRPTAKETCLGTRRNCKDCQEVAYIAEAQGPKPGKKKKRQGSLHVEPTA